MSRPLERIKPRPADRRKEIRDKKLVGMKPHRLVVRLPDGRSGGARRKPQGFPSAGNDRPVLMMAGHVA